MFKELMNKIGDFLDYPPDDIYEFSVSLEDTLTDDYDELHEEQPGATEILASEVPYLCAEAEPGMTVDEIEDFRERLKTEYEKAQKAMI